MQIPTPLGQIDLTFAAEIGGDSEALLAFWGGPPEPGKALPFATLTSGAATVQARGCFTITRAANVPLEWLPLPGGLDVETAEPVAAGVRAVISVELKEALTTAEVEKSTEARHALRAERLKVGILWRQTSARERAAADRRDAQAAALEAAP